VTVDKILLLHSLVKTIASEDNLVRRRQDRPRHQAIFAKLETVLRARLKGTLRRQSDLLFPNRETREYRKWISRRMQIRSSVYRNSLESGLLSILTPVWNGSPVRYLRTLADSIVRQNSDGACEWVILDNGCSDAQLLAFFRDLKTLGWVRLYRSETNLGILHGLRRCLDHATGRYVLPIDADDRLYPDALRIVSAWIRRAKFPAALFSDEDKIIGKRVYQPYLKPDWDPVLLVNSAYIAHLGVIDRQKALEMGAYEDKTTEGSPDWDLFVRLMLAGCEPVHIPEVLYSWRVHARSTADDAASKPYVHSSQRAVLQRFLDAQPDPTRFGVEYSPLLGGAAHWHISRRRDQAAPFFTFVIGRGADLQALAELAPEAVDRAGFVVLIGEDVTIKNPDWSWEALSLFELHRDTVMIGGRIWNTRGIIAEAGRYFGFRGACGCPNRGRRVDDPGYFAQMWKQRSVSAVSSQFAVIRPQFLLEVLHELPERASLPFLGAWTGARALRTGRRVVYSPFLSGTSDLDWETLIDPAEEQLFFTQNRDIIPDRRFYSRWLSLTKPFGFGSPEQNE
jgi:glycosyltransferase involved in cell wall biosynthesis